MEQLTNQPDTMSVSKTPLILIVLSVVLTAIIVGSGFLWWANQRQNELQGEFQAEITSLNDQLQQNSQRQIELQDEVVSLNNQLQQISQEPEVINDEESSDPTSYTQTDLNRIFGLNAKEAGTMIYYSDKLGIGFSYLSNVSSSPVTVTESDNKINVSGQAVEVFTKDPKISLEQAIEQRFLQGYNSSECFVKKYDNSEQKNADYVSAGISFPPSSDPDAPWWQNSDKCPPYYSETNGIQYFLMSKEVPGKLLFVRIGQDSVASDGTTPTEEGGFNWSHSIRILK